MNEFLIFINENTISLISAVIAFFAALISIKSYNLSKKALKISEEQHQDRTKELNLYLKNLEKHIHGSDSWVYVNISIGNNATLSKPIIKTYLEIIYEDNNHILQTVRQDSKANVNISANITEELSIPLNIKESTIISGHLYFKIPKHLRRYTIKKFRLVLITSNNNEISIESELWKEKNVKTI